MGVVINFILHCYRCDTSKMCDRFPWCLCTSLAFAATKVDVISHKIYVQWDVPHKPSAHSEIGQWMPYNFADDSFHTNFVADFLRMKLTFIRETAILRFWAPFGGGLEAMHDSHLRLIGKHAVDFLLVTTQVCLLGAIVDTLQANIDWKAPFFKGWVTLIQNLR